MKALILKEKGILQVSDVPVPEIQDGELLVKMQACGICGTDIEKVKGEAVTPPVLGHEVVGIISKSFSSSENLRSGDRVFAHHHAPCYECELCKRGEYTLCEEFPEHNIRPGGFAEYYAVPGWNVERKAVLKIPENISFEVATFIEPLGCCIRGLNKVWSDFFDSAVIYGAGPTGLIFLKLLKIKNCKIIVADLSEYRRSFALRLGAAYSFDPRNEEEKRKAIDKLSKEPEIAIVATGSTSALLDAIKTVSKGGRVLIFGSPTRGSYASIDTPYVFLKGINISTSYSTSELETREALRMISEREIRLDELITHKFRLEDAVKAFEVAMDQKCIKAIVVPD